MKALGCVDRTHAALSMLHLQAARATVGGKKVNPDLVLSREQRARIQHQKDVEEWKKKDTDFHESNRTVSTALFLWNETNGAAPEKPAM